MLQHIFKTALIIGLFLLTTNSAHAQSATIMLESEKTSVAPNEEVIVDVKLCTEENVTTAQIKVDLSLSQGTFEASAKGDTDAFQFVVEEKYEDQIATIVGGTPNGLQMEPDGCAKIGEIMLQGSEEAVIVANVDFTNSAALGGGNNYIDTEQTPSEEDNSSLTITVSNQAIEVAPPTNLQVEPLIASAQVTWNGSAASYELYFMTASAYNEDNDALLQQQATQIQSTSYTLAALTEDTEYVVTVRAVDTDQNTSEAADPIFFQTETLRGAAPTDTTDFGIPPEPTPITISAQPTQFTQTQDQQAFTHTATGPEHVIIGGLALFLLSWYYLRKKLA